MRWWQCFCAFGSNLKKAKQKWSQDLLKQSESLHENCVILNPKNVLTCLGKYSVSDFLRFCREDVEDSDLETVLGIQIGN